LEKHLAGRKVLRCQSTREDIATESFTDKRVKRVFCKGKHIFLEFEGGLFLHNHLLMRGTWKKLEGQQLFLPPNAWIALYVGPYTICNLGGQMLKVVTKGDVDDQLASLGPDAMDKPFPGSEIAERLMGQRLPIAEALLDQSVLAGIGNIAKSEVLFSAGIDPRAKVSELGDGEMPRLLNCIQETLWGSYHNGGSWKCSVYRKAGEQCVKCGGTIRLIKQPPSRRATYFCPKCSQ
jgi:endonuclease-8